ncbi:MAG: UDP-galactopyranose mutase [Lachnospiraceae bacterium]|nr:UDP-galactopyranose mutase [Lachnospiraceae bacterium]
MRKHYDYLIVGTGLYGSVFSHEMKKNGKKCYAIDKRNHVGGNIYTRNVRGIQVHEYGAHIFHTSNTKIWDYVSEFADFNHYVNSPIAVYKDEIYNLPFNMNTFSRLWGIKTPAEAKTKIQEQIAQLHITEPQNLEEQALSLAGTDVYEKLIKGYTEKQWGRDCRELPAFIIKRLPFRFTYDNNYFNDRYQGIPIGGYTQIIEKLLEGTEVALNVKYRDFVKKQMELKAQGQDYVTWDKVLYTGMIDEYFDYRLGSLEYRSLRFEQEVMPDCDNFQGNAVVNYTEREIPFTRIIEHKHFEFGKGEGTVITREYPVEWRPEDKCAFSENDTAECTSSEPYYPVNNERNDTLFVKYKELAKKEPNVIFGGRLGAYKYYDMDKVIEAALDTAETEIEK